MKQLVQELKELEQKMKVIQSQLADMFEEEVGYGEYDTIFTVVDESNVQVEELKNAWSKIKFLKENGATGNYEVRISKDKKFVSLRGSWSDFAMIVPMEKIIVGKVK